MPNIDKEARAWELALAGPVGAAIQARRKVLKLSAAQLAKRTEQLGYPISRVAIAKIETNARVGKLGFAELVTLAEALGMSPLELAYPGGPAGRVEYLPGQPTSTLDASARFVGNPDWLAGLRDQLHQLTHALAGDAAGVIGFTGVASGTVTRKDDQ